MRTVVYDSAGNFIHETEVPLAIGDDVTVPTYGRAIMGPSVSCIKAGRVVKRTVDVAEEVVFVWVRLAEEPRLTEYSEAGGVFTAKGVIDGVDVKLVSTDGLTWTKTDPRDGAIHLDADGEFRPVKPLPNRYGALGRHFEDCVSGCNKGAPSCRHSVALTAHCSRCQELRSKGDEMPTELRGEP